MKNCFNTKQIHYLSHLNLLPGKKKKVRFLLLTRSYVNGTRQKTGTDNVVEATEGLNVRVKIK